MAELQNFRSAFNGFNREDVVHYIEYLNNRHHTQVGQLNSQLDSLRQELETLKQNPQPSEEMEEKLTGLQESNDRLMQQLQESENHCAELQEDLDELLSQPSSPAEELTEVNETLDADLQKAQDRCAMLEQQLAEANEKLAQAAKPAELELEAYRRAERAERLASERVEQMYQQANGTLAEATGRVDEAYGEVSDAADQVMAQLNQLQTIFADSKQSLQSAAAAMYAIRPLTEAEIQTTAEEPAGRNVVCKVSKKH